MEKQLIIGLGTGRCGTVSLYRLLKFQKYSFFTHESKPLLTWKFNKDLIDNKLRKYSNKDEKYSGEVNLSFLPYVEYIIKKNPSSKFIVLKRSKEEVVSSFVKHSGLLNHNYWVAHGGKGYRKAGKWDRMFPKYHAETKEEAIGLYWEDYNRQVEKLIKRYPKNIKVFQTKDLNSYESVKEILDFCGIKKINQRVKINIKENKKGDLTRFFKYFFWRADKI